jgi:hypothetical protein
MLSRSLKPPEGLPFVSSKPNNINTKTETFLFSPSISTKIAKNKYYTSKVNDFLTKYIFTF